VDTLGGNMYITPTNKDQEGKEFILTVTGNRWTENQYGEGKRDREVLNDETNSNDVLVLTEGWFKDSGLENVKKGDKLTISFDKTKPEWFNVKIEPGEPNGHSTTYLDADQIAKIDDRVSRQEQVKLEKKIVAEGQVRFGFSKEAFRMGLELDEKTKKRIEAFTDYVMNPRYKQDTPQDPPPHTDNDVPF
jgi:hypothetical protein